MRFLSKSAKILVTFGMLYLPAKAQDVDLELLLAVDASGSVSQAEFELQLGGIAAAFRDPEIVSAIETGSLERIAVSLMLWSDGRSRKVNSEWVIVDGPLTAELFSQTVLAQVSRRKSFLGRGGTGIGAAIGHGVKLIERNGISAIRRVIDVSGDGHETPLAFGEAMALPEALKRARRGDVTVNGLAILSDDPHLLTYYKARVIRGPASFAIAADDFEDFARAIKIKLLREIRLVIGRPAIGPKGLEADETAG